MNPFFTWASFLSVCGLAACATTAVVYPEFHQPPSISVSTENVSTLTETPAGDYLIPGSQVFVARKGEGSRYLGLLGVAIEKSRSESGVAGHADPLRITFKDELTEALKVAAERSASKTPISVVDTGGDIMMLPSARLVIMDGPSADVSFRIAVRFKDLASGKEGRKDYWYLYGPRSLLGADGLAENNGRSFKEAANQAMTRLAQVILEDLAGGFRDSANASQQRLVRWKSASGERVVTSALLREEPDYFIVMPVIREQRAAGVIVTLPKAAIQLQP